MTIQTKPFHASRAQSRGLNAVQGVVLHEVNESAGQVDGRMQTALTHVGLAHQSYHYAVDASAIRAYVPITDAVYAIADTDTMSPWTIAAANPGIEPDLYTVNVAVLIGAAPMSNPCVPGCERTYPAQLLQNLQRLLAMIGIAAEIDITDTEVVWRHGTELCDLDVEPLLEPIDPFDPGQEDWLCDRLAALPLGESETPMLVGSDCATYTPQQVVMASGILSNCNAQAPNGTFLMRPFGYTDLELNNLLALGVDTCAKFVLVNVTGPATTNPGGFYVTTSLPDGTLSINTPVSMVINSNPNATFVLPVTNGQYRGLLQGGDGMPEKGYADEIRLTVLGWW